MDTPAKPTKRARAKAHAKRHATKYSAGLGAVLIFMLQLMHVWGPLLCSLPFVTDTDACHETVQRADDAILKLDEEPLQ